MSVPHDDEVFTAARHALGLLHHEAEGLRKELVALRQDIADARREFDSTRAACLMEANENLVLGGLAGPRSLGQRLG